ncbi:MAG: M20/M25/M40 family metallo-hydrolase, partial [Microbacterium sp.]
MPQLDLSASSLEITRAVCDIPSVSDDETALADAIYDAVSPFGHLTVERDGDTIIARTDLGRAQRVAIAGHIDTVPINDNLPARDIDVDGEPFLWGRGTVDMKAGVAVQLKLAAELVAP